jgi:hypothetical protein
VQLHRHILIRRRLTPSRSTAAAAAADVELHLLPLLLLEFELLDLSRPQRRHAGREQRAGVRPARHRRLAVAWDGAARRVFLLTQPSSLSSQNKPFLQSTRSHKKKAGFFASRSASPFPSHCLT